MNPKITIEKRASGGAKQIEASLENLRRISVLVGIPQAANSRSKDPVGNAGLMYIHTNGSPARRIPARPVIQPAIAASGNKEIIEADLQRAATMVFKGNVERAIFYLRRAGQAATNASKAWFTDPRNHWAPNRPSTIKRKGSSQPLIDTGALRRSLTFVVRQEEGGGKSHIRQVFQEVAHAVLDVLEEA